VVSIHPPHTPLAQELLKKLAGLKVCRVFVPIRKANALLQSTQAEAATQAAAAQRLQQRHRVLLASFASHLVGFATTKHNKPQSRIESNRFEIGIRIENNELNSSLLNQKITIKINKNIVL